jgi:hypothetical protein
MTNQKSAIKDYNLELRSYVLNLALSIEELSTLIVKSLLRKVKPNSKTLDNKSSNLSFKNKIDILHDLGDISGEAYNQFVKFMEIRNQFIHNPKCNNFVDLETISPDLIKFLKKEFQNSIDDKEDSFIESFKKLHIHTFGNLLILLGEYKDGEQEEVIRYMNSILVNDIVSVLENCKEIWLKMRKQENINTKQLDEEYMLFYNSFKQAFDNKVSKISDIYESDFPVEQIYSRKKDLK